MIWDDLEFWDWGPGVIWNSGLGAQGWFGILGLGIRGWFGILGLGVLVWFGILGNGVSRDPGVAWTGWSSELIMGPK